MKQLVSMIIILLSIIALCVWDGILTNKTFNYLEKESLEICTQLEEIEIKDSKLKNKIFALNDYWTEKMDTLCISISRKDLQIVSDYLQFLCASCINENNEEAIIYSRLLNYNIIGLKQSTGYHVLNLL